MWQWESAYLRQWHFDKDLKRWGRTLCGNLEERTFWEESRAIAKTWKRKPCQGRVNEQKSQEMKCREVRRKSVRTCGPSRWMIQVRFLKDYWRHCADPQMYGAQGQRQMEQFRGCIIAQVRWGGRGPRCWRCDVWSDLEPSEFANGLAVQCEKKTGVKGGIRLVEGWRCLAWKEDYGAGLVKAKWGVRIRYD